MTIKDSIKKVFGGHSDDTTTGTGPSTTTGTTSHSAMHSSTAAHQPTGTNTVEQHRTVRAPDPHVPAGTAAGHTLETQRRHADTMPAPEMESEVWPDVHGKYREASKEARLTNQNAKLAEEELEKLRLAQGQAHDATARQAQLKEEAARAHQQFGQFDSNKSDVARAQEAARQREAQAAQLAQEAEIAKRAALEKQRAAQGLGPQGQQAERELQATAAEIEANKRRAGEVHQHQQTLEQLEQQRLAAERDTGRHAQALAQEKQNLQALEQQLATLRPRIHEGEQQLNHLKQREMEITNKIKQLGGKESPTAMLRELEQNHQHLVQRATAAQAAIEEQRRLQHARLQEAQAAEQHYKQLLGRLDPANADVQRAKQEAERLAAQMRDNEARAHDLAKRHQGLLSEVETHTRTLQNARTDAEKHMQLYNKYENEAEAAHSRKQERWGEANQLVGQMGEHETTRFSSMQEKIKEFGSKLMHPGQAGQEGVTTTTTQHHTGTGMPGQGVMGGQGMMGGQGQTTTAHHHTSTTQGPATTGTTGYSTGTTGAKQPMGGVTAHRVTEE